MLLFFCQSIKISQDIEATELSNLVNLHLDYSFPIEYIAFSVLLKIFQCWFWFLFLVGLCHVWSLINLVSWTFLKCFIIFKIQSGNVFILFWIKLWLINQSTLNNAFLEISGNLISKWSSKRVNREQFGCRRYLHWN